jgi:hypothetical protein
MAAGWQAAVAVVPDCGFQSVSFVNGICTQRGGTHVTATVDAIMKKLLPYVAKRVEGAWSGVCVFVCVGRSVCPVARGVCVRVCGPVRVPCSAVCVCVRVCGLVRVPCSAGCVCSCVWAGPCAV